jgi:hypothetical protein
MFLKNSLKVLIIGVVAFALATVTYAYAAANVVPPGSAGDGSGTITGYTVSAIAYTLDATTPSKIAKITFTLNVAASQVEVSTTGATPYQVCTISGGTSVTCTFSPEPTVAAASSLQVIATQ